MLKSDPLSIYFRHFKCFFFFFLRVPGCIYSCPALYKHGRYLLSGADCQEAMRDMDRRWDFNPERGFKV